MSSVTLGPRGQLHAQAVYAAIATMHADTELPVIELAEILLRISQASSAELQRVIATLDAQNPPAHNPAQQPPEATP